MRSTHLRSTLRPQSQHLIAAVVALLYLALALAGGGYSVEVLAVGSIVVWWTVIVGLVFGAWPRAPVPSAAIVAGACLAGFAALTLLSLAWATDDGGVFVEFVRASGYAGLFVLVVLASGARTARSWLIGLALGLLGVAALALGSRFQPSLFPHQDLPTFLPAAKARLSYPVNYWNGLGACMALSIVSLAWLGSAARSRVGRAAAIAAIPVPALALFLTSSRGGVFALAAGLAVLIAAGPARLRLLSGALLGGAGAGFVIVLANRRDAFVDGNVGTAAGRGEAHEILLLLLIAMAALGILRFLVDRPLARPLALPRLAKAVILVVVAAAVLTAVAAADPAKRIDSFKAPPPETPVQQRGFVSSHIASGDSSGRYQFWQAAWKAFESEPLRGIGAGGYEAWWSRHGTIMYQLRDAHSLYFESLAELGIGGFLLIVGFIAVAVAAWFMRWQRAGLAEAGAALALLGAATASSAIDWTWELPAAFVPLVVAAALVTGPALAAGPSPGTERRSRFGLGIAVLLVGWIAVCAAAVALLTQAKLDDSRASVRQGDLQEAAKDANEASVLQPWAAAPYLQLALVEERRGDLRRARAALSDALDRAPDDWRLWIVAVRLRTKSGDIKGAQLALRRARTLNPHFFLFSQRAR